MTNGWMTMWVIPLARNTRMHSKHGDVTCKTFLYEIKFLLFMKERTKERKNFRIND